MKASQNNKTSNSVLFSGVLALVTVVPLVVVPAALVAYSLPKLSLLATIVILSLGLIIVRAFIVGKVPAIRGLLPLIVGVYFAFTFLSFWQSIDQISGLYGHYGRFDGLITYLVFAGLFLVAMQIRWSDDRLLTLLLAMVAVGFLIALLAIGEYYGLSVFRQHSSERVAATLGNPVFLGAYLTVVFSAAFSFTQIRLREVASKVMMIAALIILSAIIMTSSRSSMLGVVLVVVVVIWRYRARLKFNWRALLAFAIGASLLVVLIEIAATGANRPTLSSSLAARSVRSAFSTRAEMTKSSIKIISNNPTLGSGPSNYPWAYQKVQSRRDARLNGWAWRNDDAHNIWLQIGASLGVPALIAMIILITVFLRTGWRLSKKDELVLPLVVGVMSFLIVSTFEPVNVTTNLLFWLFLGIMAEKVAFEAEAVKKDDGTKAEPYKRSAVAFIWVGAFILVGISAFLLIKTTVADIYYGQALASKRSNNPNVVYQFTKAISIAPNYDAYHVGLGEYFVERAKLSGSDKQMLMGIDNLEKGVYWGKNDPENWIKLALAYKDASNNIKSQNRAMVAAKTALRLSPNFPPVHRALAEVYIDEGNLKTAQRHAEDAIRLDPGYPEGWLWLGLTHEKLGQKAEAISAYGRASKFETTQVEAAMRLKALER